MAESLDALVERRGDWLPHLLAGLDPATVLERQELCQRVLAALAKLPPRAQLIFDLRSRGMSFRDISCYLRLTPSAVSRLYQSMTETLRKELGSDERAA